MSEQQEDLLQDKRDQISIMIAVAGPKREIPVKYENAEVFYQEDYSDSTPEFYNILSARKSWDLSLFIGEGHNLADENSINEIIEYTQNDACIGFGGFYSDMLVVSDGKILCHKFNMSYDMNVYRNKVPLNLPFVIASDLYPKFNKEIEILSLWDGLLSAMKRSLLFHIPKPLFTIDNALKQFSLSKELDKINAIHYS